MVETTEPSLTLWATSNSAYQRFRQGQLVAAHIEGDPMTRVVDFSQRYAYDAYMASPEWKATRAERILLDGGKCVRCDSSSQLQVHHRNYDRFGDGELTSDLETLCKRCHQKEHGLDPVKGNISAKRRRAEERRARYEHFLKGMAELEQGLLKVTWAARALSDVNDERLVELERLVKLIFQEQERDSIAWGYAA